MKAANFQIKIYFPPIGSWIGIKIGDERPGNVSRGAGQKGGENTNKATSTSCIFQGATKILVGLERSSSKKYETHMQPKFKNFEEADEKVIGSR